MTILDFLKFQQFHIEVVFMGSEKYPIENDFDSFLNKHGGDSNAHTLKEQVTERT